MTFLDALNRVSREMERNARKAERDRQRAARRVRQEPPPETLYAAELDLAEMAWDQIPGAQEAFNELLTAERSLSWAQRQVQALRRLQLQIEEQGA